ncbi:hypothetical protein CHUAL_007723 [Chamberlinius hualienensis]
MALISWSSVFIIIVFIVYLNSLAISKEPEDDRTDAAGDDGERCIVKGTRRVGFCVEAAKCKEVSDILTSNPTEEQKNALEQKICKVVQRIPYVCCETGQNVKRLISKPSEKISNIMNPQTNAKNIGLNDKECGYSSSGISSFLIIGGVVAKLGEWPWMAAVFHTDYPSIVHCGATIISSQWLLTAAHCIVDLYTGELLNHNDYSILLGAVDILQGAPDSNYRVTQLIAHKTFNVYSKKSDIGLMKLDKSIVYNDFVKPLCLPTDDLISNDFSGEMAYAVGWGQVNQGENSNTKLMKLQLNVVGNTVCQSNYANSAQLTIASTQICAGLYQPSKGTCSGDSGGPLVYQQPNTRQWYAIGILSFGAVLCGDVNFPDVFTRSWFESDLNWSEMAQLLGSVLGGLAGTILRGFSDQSYPSESVIEVRAELYAQKPVVEREDCLVLYGPHNEQFEVVLHLPCYNSAIHVYSLFRSKNFNEASKHFHIYKNSIPTLIKCKEEFSTRNKLQSVCTLLREHPSWSSAHLGAHLGMVEMTFWNNPDVSSHLNLCCDLSGQTPLHVAVTGEKFKVVQILLDLNVVLNMADLEGNTVYHLAAKTNKDMIQMLVNRSSDLINQRNIAGQTPLHLACIADKPDCVKALIYAGADVNATGTLTCETEAPATGSARGVIEMYPRQFHVKDMKHGGTPLHWAMSREVVEALIELGCQIDARDFKGDSALHTMILRGRVQCTIALMGYGADINACNEDLNTPLHLAVKCGNIQLIKALLVFGADVNMVNKFGDSPRHLGANLKTAQSAEIIYILTAAGGKRCDFGKNNCANGCLHGGQYEGAPKQTFTPTLKERHLFDEMLSQATVVAALNRRNACGGDNMNNNSNGYRLLCLDGGGIRGLVLIQLLVAIENAVGKPLTEVFDWISGTSTGGILALLIATGKSAKYCQSVYFRLKNKVFNGLRPYDSEPLEKFLQKELGENTKMSDIKFPKVAVTGVLADRHPAELHLFRNYTCPLSMLGMENQGTAPFSPTLPPEEQLMWRAARASGAAPTYFRALGRFVDGGLVSNNPTLDMLTEIHEYNYALKATGKEDEVRQVSCVVSLGTGKAPVQSIGAIDVYSPQSMWDAAKMAFGMSALGNLLVDQATSSDGRVVDRARAWCSMISVPYFRFNPDLSEDVALDETKDEILVNMLWETMLYMRSKRKELSELAAILNHSN